MAREYRVVVERLWAWVVVLLVLTGGVQAGVIQSAEYAGHTYYLLEMASWQASQDEAEQLGGYLVTVNDAAEDAWIFETFRAAALADLGGGGGVPALWVGLIRDQGSSEWYWVNGEASVYRNWADGQPQMSSTELTAGMFLTGDDASTWHDIKVPPASWDKVYGIVEVEACGGADPGTWTDAGCSLPGTFGSPTLTACGSLTAGSENTITLSSAALDAMAGLFFSFTSAPTPFKGGTLKPFPPLLSPVVLTTGPGGEIPLSLVPPAGIPQGTELWVQWVIQDAAAVFGFSLSNAIQGSFP